MEQLKKAAIERFQKDGYTNPLEGDDWKRFDPIAPPAPDSDDGLLFQDPDGLDEAMESLGQYARSMDFRKDEKFQLLNRLLEQSM